MTTPPFTNDVTRDHRKNRERLAPAFPAALDFLVALEALYDESAGRFHLGTDQNLHLYLDDRFLTYIRLDKLTTPRPSLVFSPLAHNDYMKEGTRRASSLLFPKPLMDLVEKHRGGSGGWAKRERQAGVEMLRIVAGAPEAFFRDVRAELRALL